MVIPNLRYWTKVVIGWLVLGAIAEAAFGYWYIIPISLITAALLTYNLIWGDWE